MNTHVTFEQSKWLKEKGFNVKVEGLFFDGEFINIFPKKANNTDFASTRYNSAPEQWQVVEWLRINHGIWVYPLPIDDDMKLWQCRVIKGEPFTNVKNTLKIITCGEISYRSLHSPQEAYSAAIDYILNNLI